MKFGKIGAALSSLLGIDTSEMSEVELAAAIEDAAATPETAVVETVETIENAETASAEEAVNYAEQIATLTEGLNTANASIESMGNLITILANRVSKLSVVSATPTPTAKVVATNVVSGVQKLTAKVDEVADTIKDAKALNLNEFAAVASIK